MVDYREKLFATYNKTHVTYVDSSDKEKLEFFSWYVKNYVPYIGAFGNKAAILEIGCNKGYLLRVLRHLGYERLYGIDLSPEDVEIAGKIVPEAKIECIDAFTFLEKQHEKFDIVIMKAVLEHIEKQKVILLLQSIYGGMKKGGRIIIDVPNMDWLFAAHERYMDFTHEVGFSKESLAQIMRSVFSDVTIVPVDNVVHASKIDNVKKKVARYVLSKLLNWADGEGGGNPIWARSIIGIGTKE